MQLKKYTECYKKVQIGRLLTDMLIHVSIKNEQLYELQKYPSEANSGIPIYVRGILFITYKFSSCHTSVRQCKHRIIMQINMY